MDLSALFKITYGLFIVGVEHNNKLNGCVINTASQVTAEPPRVIVTMQKDTLTAEMINQKKSMSLSVLSHACTMDMITKFGYHSGRDTDKFKDIDFKRDEQGNPYIPSVSNAVVNLKVERTEDVDTHWLFICSVEDTFRTGNEPSLTYDDYRKLKDGKGNSSKLEEEKEAPVKYICTVCHYVYDGDVPFEDLPDDYICPICKVPKSKFVPLNE